MPRLSEEVTGDGGTTGKTAAAWDNIWCTPIAVATRSISSSLAGGHATGDGSVEMWDTGMTGVGVDIFGGGPDVAAAWGVWVCMNDRGVMDGWVVSPSNIDG